MTTQKDAAEFTIDVVARWAGWHYSDLKHDTHLFNDLDFDRNHLRTLSGALRYFVQLYRPQETIRIRHIKSANRVGALVKLVVDRSTGSTIDAARMRALVRSATAEEEE